jgi:hypothetical protein
MMRGEPVVMLPSSLNLARYLPEMRDAIETRWEPFLQDH